MFGRQTLQNLNEQNSCLSRCMPKTAARRSGMQKNNAKVFGETEFPRPPSFPTSKTFKLTAVEIARIRPEKSINTQRGIEREREREIER